MLQLLIAEHNIGGTPRAVAYANGHSVDYFEQQNSLPAFKEVWPEYKELGSQTLQAT